jgi:hypothetical protein
MKSEWESLLASTVARNPFGRPDVTPVGDKGAAKSNLGSAGLDVGEVIPGVGSFIAAGRKGYAIGELINEFLPEEAQDAIGGTISETLEHGLENMKNFYLGGTSKGN